MPRRWRVRGWAAATEAAPERANEDRFGADGTLFSIADGLGGLTRGDLAAEAAVTGLHALHPRSARQLEHALAGADEAVRNVGRSLGADTGATLTAVLVLPRGWWAVHAGDTRAWLRRDGGELVACTEDDNAAHRLGVEPDDSRYDQLATVLTAHLGARTRPTGHAVALPAFRRDARVLLTSDGVHDHLAADAIARLTRDPDPQAAADALVAAAVEAGTDDDATAVVVDVQRTGGWSR
jgi:serine/threonine protein phosphatase PrpC